ncbi:6-phosphogluconate dehydrogenase, decarboxylating [Rhodococcus wratislaviensis]|uniref:6-phosphogluconate dehydrogenase, decarboxylating n=1 Tax=Rhodococcus wratislaviensis TaxID=44752 RepID=A0A402C3N2_RHOWR|nr:6-phosphogluconate dehydrogenase, decarboxylating [Rhodococcus wratislaviensis]
MIVDAAEQKGTGRWTVKSALDLGVPVTGIAEAVFARALSGSREQRKAAYDENPKLPSLILAPYFRDAIETAIDSWRRVVSTATLLGIPVPAFASSLSYYDALRAERLPAALTQGQRDFFGAHTYERVDAEGKFHTIWSGDRSEVQ